VAKKDQIPPQSFEEALKARPENPPQNPEEIPDQEDLIAMCSGNVGSAPEPEPTMEELTAGALAEENVERMISDPDQDYPPMEAGEESILERPMTSQIPANQEQQTTPVSITNLPHAGMTCTQESQDDLNLRRLLDFVYGTEFGIDWVRQSLTYISAVPNILPPSPQWKLPWGMDVAEVVFSVVKGIGYIALKWPGLKVVMGESEDNTEWCAKVLCTMALFDAIHVMGKMYEISSKGLVA
jgi:hypothetical protein